MYCIMYMLYIQYKKPSCKANIWPAVTQEKYRELSLGGSRGEGGRHHIVAWVKMTGMNLGTRNISAAYEGG